MLKSFIDIGRQIFTLTRDVQQSKEAIGALQLGRKDDGTEIKRLNDKVAQLTAIVQQLVFDGERRDDRYEAERKMLLLEVENTVLKYGRALPPSDKSETDKPE